MSHFKSGFALVVSERIWTLADLAADSWGLRSRCPRGGHALIESDDPALVASSMIVLDGWARSVHLLSPATGVGEQGVMPQPALPSHETDSELVPTSWLVYTSGTTGTPKGFGHTLNSLAKAARASQRTRDLRWGLLYQPFRMAGLQVILQSMVAGSQLVAPQGASSLIERVRMLKAADVTALSATPTQWRAILQSGAADGWGLEQVTLGGEIADQPLLDALARSFPLARVTHVFASTETGAAFAVSDGRARFPAGSLSSTPSGIGLRIKDGCLEVHQPGAPHAQEDGFVATGDAVYLSGDRIYFRGRTTGCANVAGVKVWPEQVELALREHPDVDDAVVESRSNPISGEILTAKVVLRSGSQSTGGEIRSWMRQSVPTTHVPAVVDVVDSLTVSSSGKVARR